MKNRIFNTTFENMLRIILLLGVLDEPVNIDRITALDFICVYGKKYKVLDKNLHGDNKFGFAEFANKREKIIDAIKLSVTNDYASVYKGKEGFSYSLNDRGRIILEGIQTPYAKSYVIGAKIVCRRFKKANDEVLLKYINDMATEKKGV